MGKAKRFTTILHEPRIAHGLSMTEYAIADSIHHLQAGPHAKIIAKRSWSSASREYLAEFLGITKRTVINVINKLEEAGWVETHNGPERYVRTTAKWVEQILEFDPASHAAEGGVKKFHGGGEKISPYIYDNNNDLINSLSKEKNPNLFSETEPDLDELIGRVVQLATSSQARIDAWRMKFSKGLNGCSMEEHARRFAVEWLASQEMGDAQLRHFVSRLGSMAVALAFEKRYLRHLERLTFKKPVTNGNGKGKNGKRTHSANGTKDYGARL